MILLAYHDDAGQLRVGIRTDRGVVDGGITADAFAAAGAVALPQLERRLAEVEQTPMQESQLRLGPPVPNPGKVLCVGVNYLPHARESKMEVPSTPLLFSKFANAITGPGHDVPLLSEAQQYDYEAELVVVIGRRARRVRTEDALGHVLGYCNGNDVSARDLQFRTGQWLLGKSLDAFLPIGPYLVTADEIADPQNLRVRCWLNGELRQDATTADMIFGVADIISYASTYMTLEPGDIIATGTPEGVILGRQPQVWMKPGDVVEVEVGGLGHLRNTMTED